MSRSKDKRAVVSKFFVGSKCHNHHAFKEFSDSDWIYRTTSHDFSIKELHWMKENGHFFKGSYCWCWVYCICKNSFKTKITKKHGSDISSLEFIHMRPMYHKIETEVQTISSSLLALVLNVPEHSVFIWSRKVSLSNTLKVALPALHKQSKEIW